MDKERRTISIRLNDEEKSEPPESHKEESAAAEEKEFEWILPERRDSRKIVELKKRHIQKKAGAFYEKKSPRLPVGRKKKKHLVNKKPIITLQKKVVASAAFAIILGILFGFGLLMVFSGDSVATIDDGYEEAATTTTDLDLSLDFHVVQSGAYETEESAKEFQDKLKENGFPAAIFKGEKYYLFIGVSPSAEGQDALGAYYEGKGQDVYKKVWSIDGQKASVSDEMAGQMKEGKALLEKLTTLDLVALSDGKLKEAEMSDIKKEVEAWNESGSGRKEWDKIGGKELEQSLNSALEELEMYASDETVPSLWVAQQHLLDGMVAFQDVVERLK
ncbi:SPOR domain-containing protein [Alkalihalobacillus hwajinpoensis]|uniref:SPOR domain-containing protein n=1 Tax=Guptibacillus hwajinpoensis TaxID=208199 RepID=UPI001883FB97|nr:SPOR domain-containing protein [Pseudalkalibacillus hwajinpoensis]MBF0706371.1 SPOR domain-containing protein [Pseudalkalibacillus hwajinpoensis]